MKLIKNLTEYKLDNDGEYQLFYKGIPFSGIMEDITSAGYKSIVTFEEGYHHGKLVGYYPNGEKRIEQDSTNGFETSTFKWYESGILKESKIFDSLEYGDFNLKKWDELGVLIYNYIGKNKEIQRWYSSGKLKFTCLNGISQYYNLDEVVAFSHFEELHLPNNDFGGVNWNHELIEKSFEQLIKDDLFRIFIWHWVELKLVKSYSLGVKNLEKLANSDTFDVKAKAIVLIGLRKIKELEHVLLNTLTSNETNPEPFGLQKSISEYARQALINIHITN